MAHFNPRIKFAQSKGIDLPLMYVYLAGYMSGEKLDLTMAWRKKIRKFYREYELIPYKEGEYKAGDPSHYSYPIAFLDPYNGKEFESIDKKGLTSSIPGNAIYDGDRMSVNTADVIVANMDDFSTSDIQDLMTIDKVVEIGSNPGIIDGINLPEGFDYKQAFFKLQEKIKNYRPSIGTIFEICWAMEQRKPVVLIVPEEKRENYEKHPFTSRASQVVGSVDELIEKKVLETFYRRKAGAIY